MLFEKLKLFERKFVFVIFCTLAICRPLVGFSSHTLLVCMLLIVRQSQCYFLSYGNKYKHLGLILFF